MRHRNKLKLRSGFSILLIRHASTFQTKVGKIKYDSLDCALSENGKKEVIALKRRLKDIDKSSRIFVSPSKRCMQTAEILFNEKNFEICQIEEIDKGFELFLEKNPECGEMGLEEWEHKHGTRRNNVFDIETIYPSGVMLKEYIKQVQVKFRRILNSTDGKILVLVSHNGIIKSILLDLLGLDDKFYSRLKIDNACFTEVCFLEGEFILRRLNS